MAEVCQKYKKVDANEVRDQLLNCLDTTLQLFVNRDLGSNVVTATQADLLRVIELLVVDEVEKYVYENLEDKVVVDMEHKEMPRPVLRGGCSQEEFQSFTQQWNQYARYPSGMDVGEFRQQLLNCADRALEAIMYDFLGSKVDTLSQTDLFKQLEELTVVVVGKDVKQMVVPRLTCCHCPMEDVRSHLASLTRR